MWSTKHELKALLGLRIEKLPQNYLTIAGKSKPIPVMGDQCWVFSSESSKRQ